MTVKKMLIVGGSENIIIEENQDYHYITLLKQHGDYDIKNISIRGISCDESFYRCIPELEQTQYDLALILWTPLSRKSVYFSDDNIDDFTMISNGNIWGFNQNHSSIRQYTKLHYAYFNNQYINVHRLLTQILIMQSYFKAKNTPLIMCRDGDDYIPDILVSDYSESHGFVNLSSSLKAILDFNNRPDHYILQKLNVLKLLIEKVDRSCWIDFENFGFETQKVDRRSDEYHAGPISHSNFFKLLISNLEKRKLV